MSNKTKTFFSDFPAIDEANQKLNEAIQNKNQAHQNYEKGQKKLAEMQREHEQDKAKLAGFDKVLEQHANSGKPFEEYQKLVDEKSVLQKRVDDMPSYIKAFENSIKGLEDADRERRLDINSAREALANEIYKLVEGDVQEMVEKLVICYALYCQGSNGQVFSANNFSNQDNSFKAFIGSIAFKLMNRKGRELDRYQGEPYASDFTGDLQQFDISQFLKELAHG